jgi:hypothetical protein
VKAPGHLCETYGPGDLLRRPRRVRGVRPARNLVRFLEPMLAARSAAALGLLVVLGGGAGGCGDPSCPPPLNSAVIQLGCVPSEPPVVKTTGPCSVCPVVLANGEIPDGSTCGALGPSQDIMLMANGAGTCHVELTFASGATSSVDVDFMSMPQGCGNEAFLPVGADGGPCAECRQVSVPDPTCDAGLEAGASDAQTDAPSDAAVDAQADAEYSPCTNRTCGPNLVCEYAMSDGCSAQGICVPFKSCGGAGLQPTYCGCDGRGVVGSCDRPGYVTAPVQSFWAVDGGWNWSAACLPCDAGGPCSCPDGGPVQPVPSCASIAHP